MGRTPYRDYLLSEEESFHPPGLQDEYEGSRILENLGPSLKVVVALLLLFLLLCRGTLEKPTVNNEEDDCAGNF